MDPKTDPKQPTGTPDAAPNTLEAETNAPIDAASYVAEHQPEAVILTEEPKTNKVHLLLVVVLAVVLTVAVGLGIYATFVNPNIFRQPEPTTDEPQSLSDYPAFSEVAAMEASYAAKAEREPRFIPDPDRVIGSAELYDDLTIERIAAEIDYLIDMRSERTADIEAQVTSDLIDIYGMPVGETTLSAMVNEVDTPATFTLLEALVNEVEAYAVKEQIKYDVARPEYFDAAIRPSVPSPATPQFPSVVGAKAYAAMFLLARLDPRHADLYLQSAEDVNTRLEITGLSFDTSTVAGAGLANRYFEFLPYSEAYMTMYEAALAEEVGYINPNPNYEVSEAELIEPADVPDEI